MKTNVAVTTCASRTIALVGNVAQIGTSWERVVTKIMTVLVPLVLFRDMKKQLKTNSAVPEATLTTSMFPGRIRTCGFVAR